MSRVIKKIIKRNKRSEERHNRLYFKSISTTRESKEYIANEIRIECIRKGIKEHTNTPDELIDILIETVEENVALEYESINKYIVDYTKKK